MQIRLAAPADAEAIRAIYNAEVTGGTNTFDLEPRSEAQQLAWLERHQGAHPAVVADRRAATVAGFGSLSPFRSRAAYSTTVEDSVYVAADHRGQGVGRALLDELVGWPPSTASTPSSPGSWATTRSPSPSTGPAASSWSGSSARSAASTAAGSTWSSSSCLV